MPGEADWDSLPQHLWHLIMEKLQMAGGMKSVAVLRLISKSLLAAFTEYSGKTACQISEEGDVARMCAIMPQMSAFRAICDAAFWVDLKPLSACSRLEAVRIAPADVMHHCMVNFAGLPNTVRVLELHSVWYPFEVLQRGSSLASLEELTISKSRAGVFDDSLLLTDLPNLKARPTFVCMHARAFCTSILSLQ